MNLLLILLVFALVAALVVNIRSETTGILAIVVITLIAWWLLHG